MATVSNDDRKALAQFVEDVSDVLKVICTGQHGLLPHRHAKRAREAWNGMQDAGNVSEVVAAIKDSNACPDQALLRAGLHGSQLKWKLDSYYHFHDRLNQGPPITLSIGSPGTRNTVGRLLSWANIILKSIASAVPGGEAIAELKDCIEDAIEDGD